MAYGFESIPVESTAVGLTASNFQPDNQRQPKRAFLTLETAQIRFTYDETTPTASVGHLMEVGEQLLLDSYDDLYRFRAIRTGSVSGVLKVTYE